MWPILLAFLHFAEFRIYLAYWILCDTASFCIRSVRLSSSSFSHATFKHYDLLFRNFQFSALQTAFVPWWWKKISLNVVFAMEILNVTLQTKFCVICYQAIQIVPLTDSLLLRHSFSQLQFRYCELFFRILLPAVNITSFIIQLLRPLRTFSIYLWLIIKLYRRLLQSAHCL